MENILRHRQLRIWEEVCHLYSVPSAKAKKVKEWIRDGTFFEHSQQKHQPTKKESRSSQDT
jgi:hypothetical protein